LVVPSLPAARGAVMAAKKLDPYTLSVVAKRLDDAAQLLRQGARKMLLVPHPEKPTAQLLWRAAEILKANALEQHAHWCTEQAKRLEKVQRALPADVRAKLGERP